MQAIHLRGQGLHRAIAKLFALLATLAGITFLVQVLIAAFGSGSVDFGWFVVAAVCGLVACLVRQSRWLMLLLASSDDSAHQARIRFVWGLLLLGLGLVVSLKLGSVDRHAYKKLLFGEGGLVEWTQVVLLVTAVRAAWLLAKDVNQRLIHSWPSVLFRSSAVLLGLLLMEELAWGQVIFGWRTPQALRDINAQNQTTLHNIGWFQDHLDLGYFLVTLLLLAAIVLAPWFAGRLRSRASQETAEIIRCITPPRYLWPLFFAGTVLAFFVATRSASGIVLNRDQEWGELLLYGSFALILLRARVLMGPTATSA